MIGPQGLQHLDWILPTDTLPYLLDLLQSYTFNSSNQTMTQPADRSRRETNQVRG